MAISGSPRKLFAFARRDWQLASQTPLSLAYEWGQALAGLLSFYFIAKLTPFDQYFRFVLLGMMGAWVMSAGLSSVNEAIQFERAHGTLEAILLTEASPVILFFSKLASQSMWLAGKILICLFFGIGVLGVRFPGACWGAALLSLVLTFFVFLGLGCLSAALALAFRDPGPWEGLVEWGLRFSGSVYFPITLLPKFLQRAARANPLTQGLEGIRLALNGSALHVLNPPFLFLSALAGVLLLLGSLALRWSMKEAKRSGRLGFPP